MIYKLSLNTKKGRWDGVGIPKALDLLHGEYEELVDAVNRGNMVETLLEAADVGNFALIVSAIAMERGLES